MTPTNTSTATVKPSARLYRETARFHERAALALFLYGQVHQANAARAIAFLCRMRAERMDLAAA